MAAAPSNSWTRGSRNCARNLRQAGTGGAARSSFGPSAARRRAASCAVRPRSRSVPSARATSTASVIDGSAGGASPLMSPILGSKCRPLGPSWSASSGRRCAGVPPGLPAVGEHSHAQNAFLTRWRSSDHPPPPNAAKKAARPPRSGTASRSSPGPGPKKHACRRSSAARPSAGVIGNALEAARLEARADRIAACLRIRRASTCRRLRTAWPSPRK
jgi:hypothetical protein